jgi:hypothetical protein
VTWSISNTLWTPLAAPSRSPRSSNRFSDSAYVSGLWLLIVSFSAPTHQSATNPNEFAEQPCDLEEVSLTSGFRHEVFSETQIYDSA